MTALIRPSLRLRSQWVEMAAEFAADGSTQHGSGLWDFAGVDLTETGAAGIIDALLVQADQSVPPAAGRVHCTYFWIVDRGPGDASGDSSGDDAGDDSGGPGGSGELVGYLALRHTLNAWLLEQGGHIGYSVRPTRRRRGHASRALALAVQYAGAELALDRVLVICEDDNLASARTIERCGGVCEDVRNGHRRYWIPTGAEDGRT